MVEPALSSYRAEVSAVEDPFCLTDAELRVGERRRFAPGLPPIISETPSLSWRAAERLVPVPTAAAIHP